jgi:spore maturation protein CgeB
MIYDIAFFGAAFGLDGGAGAARHHRGVLRALHERGHRITVYEPHAGDAPVARDAAPAPWATVGHHSSDDLDAWHAALDAARRADIVIMSSTVSLHASWLAREVLALKRGDNQLLWWDADAAATLERVLDDPRDAFRALIPQYDGVLTCGGGPPVATAYRALGAKGCTPLYPAIDPDTHYPVPAVARYQGLCGFLGHRAPDREARVREFLFEPARRLSSDRFLLGGTGWAAGDRAPCNVDRLGAVQAADHNAFHCSPRAILSITRDGAARTGYTPPRRLFEAAGAAACVVMDDWPGADLFLEPGREVLVARSGVEVADVLSGLTIKRARALGNAALVRVLAEHTYANRALAFEQVVENAVVERLVA